MHRILTGWLTLMLASPFCSKDLWAETLVLKAAADTALHEVNPNNNMGGHSHFAAGSTAKGSPPTRSRGLFRFTPVEQLPKDAEVLSVKIQIQVTGVPGGGGAESIFALHRVRQSWGEGRQTGNLGAEASAGEATWNARSAPNSLWAKPGGGASEDYVAEPSAQAMVQGVGTYTFGPTAELTEDLRQMVVNPGSNHGWMLISQSEEIPQTARRFGTRESGTGAELIVEFIAPVVAAPPVITAQPKSVTVVAGQTAQFEVVADGSGPLNYQWKFNDQEMAGQTQSAMSIKAVKLSDQGTYGVVVRNSAGSAISQTVFLFVLVPPAILVHPQAQTVKAGESARWSVEAGGTEPLRFQWKLNGTAVAGATNSVFTLDSIQLTDAGEYSVQVQNAVGSVESSPARLLVQPVLTSPPRFDRIETSGNAILLGFTAPAGFQVRCEYTARLPSADWILLTNIAAGTLPVAALVRDPVEEGSGRFYRLLVIENPP